MTERRDGHNALRVSNGKLEDFDPHPETAEAKRLADLLCPPHAHLDAHGQLLPFDNCIACIRVERDELRAAYPPGELRLREGLKADDPVRRDREGWEAGVEAAAQRLQDEIADWAESGNYNDITEAERAFVAKRIAQMKTHVAQIRELKYPGAAELIEGEKKTS